jgi:hypothetical protein
MAQVKLCYIKMLKIRGMRVDPQIGMLKTIS